MNNTNHAKYRVLVIDTTHNQSFGSLADLLTGHPQIVTDYAPYLDKKRYDEKLRGTDLGIICYESSTQQGFTMIEDDLSVSVRSTDIMAAPSNGRNHVLYVYKDPAGVTGQKRRASYGRPHFNLGRFEMVAKNTDVVRRGLKGIVLEILREKRHTLLSNIMARIDGGARHIT